MYLTTSLTQKYVKLLNIHNSIASHNRASVMPKSRKLKPTKSPSEKCIKFPIVARSVISSQAAPLFIACV